MIETTFILFSIYCSFEPKINLRKLGLLRFAIRFDDIDKKFKTSRHRVKLFSELFERISVIKFGLLY